MSEELSQASPIALGRYFYYKLGATTLRQLRAEGIVRAVIPRHLRAKKPDGLIVLRGGTTKAVVEYKSPRQLRNAKQIQKAIDQEIDVAAALCKLLIVTTGSKSIFVNALNGERVLAADGSELTTVFDVQAIGRGEVDADELERLLDSIDVSLTETNNQVAPPSVLDPSTLAATIWQKIWIQTGKSPEKCLYNVVELFVFKFLSDLEVLGPHFDFWSVAELIQKVDATSSLKHYANTCRKEVEELFPAGDDGTTIINGTIFVNESGQPNLAQAPLFAEIIRQLAAYDHAVGSFRYIKREFKTRLYESFLRQSAGVKALGQYFTPRNVVRAMVRMARPLSRGARVCDPFCGVGGFLLELLMENPELYREFVPQNGHVDPRVTLIGYDKGTDEQEDERTIILAKANMLIYFSDLLADYHSPLHLQAFAKKGLNAVFRLLRTNLGTFDRTEDEPYDLILTNPPYVTKGSKSLQDAIAQTNRTSSFYDLGLKGTEGLALNWILKNLRPGGEAFVIIPDGLLRRTAEVNALQNHCLIRAVVSLPSRTFYSTPRSTYILALEKKRQPMVQTDPVLGFIVGETGETRDALRLEIEENHLTELVVAFKQFRATPTDFADVSPRCKVFPFDEVRLRSDWRVDRWWTYDERVELGLDERVVSISDRDFASEIHDYASELLELAGNYQSHAQVGVGYGTRSVTLSNSIFSFVATKTGWTRTQLHQLLQPEGSNTAPVYSAAAQPIGHVDVTRGKLILATLSSPVISFGANGDASAGTNFVLHECPFYVTGDRTVMQINDELVDSRFVIYALRNMKARYGFDHTHKAVPKNVGTVAIEIPVTRTGEWDIETQRRIANRHLRIQALVTKLSSKTEHVTNYDVCVS